MPACGPSRFRPVSRRLGDGNQHGVAFLYAEKSSKRLIKNDLIVPRRLPWPVAAKLPEALVAADKIDQIDAGRRFAVGSFQAGGFENGWRRHVTRTVVGQLFAEEVIGDEHFVNIPQSGQHEVAEAAAHGVAYKQGPGEHGRAHRHAASNGHVHFPEVAEGEQDEAKR